jgi:hypothetical protein
VLERKSRYWCSVAIGLHELCLFEQGVRQAWKWATAADSIRWFTDGERRYGKALWKLASVRLQSIALPESYKSRKVWREGLEVAIKIKASQGHKRVEWVKTEHPFTPISAASEVHANHVEAHNAALRRHCSAYRRHQNLYAKVPKGLRRAVAVQRLVHNWVRPHWGLAKDTTPAMAMGFVLSPISMEQMLSSRGLHDFISS